MLLAQTRQITNTPASTVFHCLEEILCNGARGVASLPQIGPQLTPRSSWSMCGGQSCGGLRSTVCIAFCPCSPSRDRSQGPRGFGPRWVLWGYRDASLWRFGSFNGEDLDDDERDDPMAHIGTQTNSLAADRSSVGTVDGDSVTQSDKVGTVLGGSSVDTALSPRPSMA